MSTCASCDGPLDEGAAPGWGGSLVCSGCAVGEAALDHRLATESYCGACLNFLNECPCTRPIPEPPRKS